MSPAVQQPAVTCQLLLEITIDAPRERVWRALVEETHIWWRKDFCSGPDAVAFRLQPRLGGWMYEDWGEGNGLIWGTVSGVRAPAMLQVVGDTSPEWGGPNRGMMTWDLQPHADDETKTVLRFQHALHGAVSDATRDSLDGGWRLLFADTLKPYAETGTPPAAAGSAPCST